MTVPSDPLDRQPLVLRVFTEIGIIHQLASAELQRVLPEGLHVSQFGVLSRLARRGDAEQPHKLAEAFQVPRSSMTNTLKRLEVMGYVETAPDPHDGRAKSVRITAQGQAAFAAIAQQLAPAMERTLTAVGRDQIDTMLPLLSELRLFLDDNRGLVSQIEE